MSKVKTTLLLKVDLQLFNDGGATGGGNEEGGEEEGGEEPEPPRPLRGQLLPPTMSRRSIPLLQ